MWLLRFFSSVANKWIGAKNKKGNELIRKQQRPDQGQCGMFEAFMIYFTWMIFCWPEAMLTHWLHRKCTSKIKAWHRILGTEILSYEEFHCETVQLLEGNEI